MEGAVGRTTEQSVFPAVRVRTRLGLAWLVVLAEEELLHWRYFRASSEPEVIPSYISVLVVVQPVIQLLQLAFI